MSTATETCPNGESPRKKGRDITFSETLIISGGQYVGASTWPGIIKSLRAGQVTKIFASFGGYGVPDYQRIGEIMAKYGTGTKSPLYQNFACLKKTLGLDGIDFDDEDSYDQDTVVQFAKMLIGMGLEVTFCPYTDSSFWSGCVQALGPKNVSWLNLQCYAGGKSNNPGDWTGMGVPVVAGVCANCCCPNTTCSSQQVNDAYGLWTTGKGSLVLTAAGKGQWARQSCGAIHLDLRRHRGQSPGVCGAIASGLQRKAG